MGKTTIQVSTELRDFLDAQAIKRHETYDQILKRLLNKIWNARIIPESTSEHTS